MNSSNSESKLSRISDLKRFWNVLSLRRQRQLVGMFFAMLLGALAELLSLGAVMPFIALLAAPEKLHVYPLLYRIFVAVGWQEGDSILPFAASLFSVVTLSALFLRIFLAWLVFKFSYGVGNDISVEIYRRNLYQPYSFHIRQNSSAVLASVDKCNSVISSTILPVLNMTVSGILCVSILSGLIWIDAKSALFAGASFTLIYLSVTLATRKRLQKNGKIAARTQTARIQAVQEGVGGIRDVLIDGTQSIYVNRFQSLDLDLRDAQISTSLIGNSPRFLIEAVGMVLIAALACWISVRNGGLIQGLPLLGVLAMGAQKLIPQMQLIYYGWASFSGNRAVLRDVLEFLERSIPSEYSITERVVPLNFSTDISLLNVGFRYSADVAPVLINMNLAIPKGTRVGFVGATGSGKSTLADIIMGLLTPSSGELKVDGQLITASNRRSWQARIAHVPQFIYLSDTSIAENIAFGKRIEEIDFDWLRIVAQKAHLDGFIEELPDKYMTSVGERGVRLSGGQRQRIGIARALYKRADVLVLDEATSALDDLTERAVMDCVASLEQGITVLMIAHRTTTLIGCDCIYEISDGRILRHGTYSSLFASHA